jgi:hypothetical protein
MATHSDTAFDHIIVGDGPISRTLLFHLNTSLSQSVLVIDAGKRIQELAEKIKIESNINYDTPLRAPSFHIGKESHVWYGGCQGWPSNDTLDKSIDSLPISLEDPKFIKISNKLLRDLKVFNFNISNSKLFFSLQKKYRSQSKLHNLDFIYCKVLKDPYLRNLTKKNKTNQKNTFISDLVITKIKPATNHVDLIGIDGFGKKMQFSGKRIHLALGTIENTRLILNSKKELNLANNAYVGKFLSDHLSFSISKIGSNNINKVIRDFSRTTALDGTLLWPRISMEAKSSNQQNIGSFAHGSHFDFNDSTPLFYKFLRRIKKENYFFYKAKAGSFQLNFFLEKLNDSLNSIELEFCTEYEIAPIKIKFNVNDDEYNSHSEIAQNYFNLLKDLYSLPDDVDNFSFKLNNLSKSHLRSSVHPSGTYRMSINSKEGVVNTKSEIWNDSRIRILGSGALPRASSTHPTLISMVLARIND